LGHVSADTVACTVPFFAVQPERTVLRKMSPVLRSGRAYQAPQLSRRIAVTKEITHPNHRERQFMQHLRGVGWIKARTLPPNGRTVKSLLQKGWIEQQQHQGSKNESSFG